MTKPYTLTLRPGHPGLVDLEWESPIVEWTDPRMVELPKGISRHVVRFIALEQGTYAIKDLPVRAARRDYDALRALEELKGPAARPVGICLRALEDPDSERGAALITDYVQYSFSYRELLSGESFGPRRTQLLDAFASLLAELHALGCYWGDCSLSNVLYRYDAGAIATTMVDAETASLYPRLSDGQRGQDISIMIENVGGEMGDIAAARGVGLDGADLHLGEDIAHRYEALWAELATEARVPADQQYQITERINRLNELGFEVDEIEVVPHPEAYHVHLRVRVADRNYHANRLHELTGVEAGENQARQILADLRYYAFRQGIGPNPSGKALAATRWRVEVFEPMLRRLTEVIGTGADPVQAYCDLLHHRYLLSARLKRDVGTEVAFEDWVALGAPGGAVDARARLAEASGPAAGAGPE